MLRKTHLIWICTFLLVGLLTAGCGASLVPADDGGADAATAPAEEATEAPAEEAEPQELAGEEVASSTPWINQCEGDPVDGGTVTLAFADSAMQGENWLSAPPQMKASSSVNWLISISTHWRLRLM